MLKKMWAPLLFGRWCEKKGGLALSEASEQGGAAFERGEDRDEGTDMDTLSISGVEVRLEALVL
jgi:hypothetical protein